MNKRILILVLILTLIMSGCAQVKGRWYLTNERYEEGIRSIGELYRQNPEDPVANYYMGRYHLALEQPEQALPYLAKAAKLKSSKADYHFWLGVAYWGVMDFDKERSSYRRALATDVNHLPARLYLGHNLLDSGQWKEALKQYGIVLGKDQYNPEALYNRGLALDKLKRIDEEMRAWKLYLKQYPEGKWALKAVDHLNTHGDFSYRNHTIGYRRVTLERITFIPSSAKLLSNGNPSLEFVGSMLSINRNIEMEIVAYKKGNRSLATKRAEAVKKYLLKHYPEVHPSRITTRGVGKKERIVTKQRTYFLDGSISLVTTKK
jgi:tetratricopeptide (TPR) repeat protein